ncbi:MAG: heme lyase CcmF/NrfE family subunit [Actinobacteria bacterium]|nr:heme lyase CcmF/NrfE family subunit [Actinomycetota bacterium]
MNQIGYSALLLAVLTSAFGLVAPLIAVRTKSRGWMKTAERSVYGLCAVSLVASAALLYALVTRDYTNEYVYNYTSNELSWFYTFSAFWAGNSGSLLLWLVILAVFTAVVVWQNRAKNREILPYVISILMSIALFFSLMMVTSRGSNPFAMVPAGVFPANGSGLNPMLENPGMVVHPITLFLGYVGFAIPYAFAMAALITRRLGDFWIRSTRRWTVFAWIFLTIGNIVGAWWAYVTLGWGGYWAWDPVENASFMPWVTGTAFLHSVMIQEKKDMLKVWNIVLIVATFSLTIFGTFLVRSGVVSSVHSFGQSSLGFFFLGFLGLILVFSLNLLFSRLDMLKSRNELDSFVSRESSFLLNNLLLVGIAMTVLWGVLFPIISEAVTGNKVTVGPPFFDQVIAPIGLVLMFVTGICPLIAWRRATLANLRKNVTYPGLVAIVVLVALIVTGMRHTYAIISFTLCAFVVTTVLMEFARGAWVRREMSGENLAKALLSLTWRNKRRYGGYIVHIGVILFLFGVTGSYAFKQQESRTITKGESISVGGYEVTYDSFDSYDTTEKRVGTVTFTVSENGRFLGTVAPRKEYYFAKDQPWTRIDRHVTLERDVYVSLLDYSAETGEANVEVRINPLVSWLWIGGIVMVIGGIVAIWPDKRDAQRLAARYERQVRLHEI